MRPFFFAGHHSAIAGDEPRDRAFARRAETAQESAVPFYHRAIPPPIHARR
jgi:hypothetical protein